MNATSMGEKERADRILLLELQAEREDLRDAVRHASDYYKAKYDAVDRIMAALTWRATTPGSWSGDTGCTCRD